MQRDVFVAGPLCDGEDGSITKQVKCHTQSCGSNFATPSPTLSPYGGLTPAERDELQSFVSEVQAQRAEAISALRAKRERTPAEDQELVTLIIAYQKALLETGGSRTPEEEKEFRQALVSRIDFLTDMAENRTSTENEQLMAAIEMRIEAICGTSALVTGRCQPDSEGLNETRTLQEELEAMFFLTPS